MELIRGRKTPLKNAIVISDDMGVMDVETAIKHIRKALDVPNRDGFALVDKENDMGVKEILDRLYAYKNGTEDESLIDDVIQMIIDLDRMTWKAPSGATWNVGASNGWKGE